MMIVIFRIAALLRCSFEFSAIQAPAAFDKVFAGELKLLRLRGGIEVDNVRLSAQDRRSAMRIDAGPDRFAVFSTLQPDHSIPSLQLTTPSPHGTHTRAPPRIFPADNLWISPQDAELPLAFLGILRGRQWPRHARRRRTG
jgi:hypothetical protein